MHKITTHCKSTRKILLILFAIISLTVALKTPTGSASTISNDKGLLLDVARHPMNKRDVINALQAASDSGFNYVTLHLSDDENCSFAPHFANGQGLSREVLSDQDLSEIASFAKQHHLYIVPDVDFPSHAQALLTLLKKNQPSLAKRIIMDGTSDTLDYTNPEAANFANEIYKQMTDIFGNQSTRYLSIGVDEVSGDSTELVSYINKINNVQNSNGFNVIVWNDSLLKSEIGSLDKNVTINFWSQYGSRDDYKARGNERISVQDIMANHLDIVNSNQSNYYSYSDIGDDWDENNFIKNFRKRFKPNYFDEVVNGQKKRYTPENTSNTGYLVCLWGEDSSDIPANKLTAFIHKLSVINKQ